MTINNTSMLYELLEYRPLIFNDEKVNIHMKKFFDSSLDKDIISVTDDTHIGIEVEIEKIDDLRDFSHLLQPTWNVVSDGSLRNKGYEFVSIPIRGDNIYKALRGLRVIFEKYTPRYEFSERTSIHVHMNARRLTLEQLFCLLLTYMVVERSLFRFVEASGFIRDKNIFCAPIQDSKWYLNLHSLISLWEEKKYDKFFHNLLHSWKKYTSLNIIPLQKLGTLEFRHMGGTMDLDLLMNWINILLSLRRYAENSTAEKIMSHIENLNTNSNYTGFMEEVFGQYAHVFNEPLFSSRIEEGVTQIKECIVSAREKQEKITVEEFKESSSMRFFIKNKYELGFSDIKLFLVKRDELTNQYNRLVRELEGSGNQKVKLKQQLKLISSEIRNINAKIEQIQMTENE